VAELFLRSSLLSAQGVLHGFSLREGGVSKAPFGSLNLGKAVGDDPAAVDENLNRFLSAVGLPRAQLVTVNQVHGDTVVVAEALAGPVDADAIVASDGFAAGVRTADCVPILLHDPQTGVSAAVHAGWKGTVAHIATRTIEAMVRVHGTRPSDLIAAIGPRIGRCCFEVSADLALRFETDAAFGPDTVDSSRPARVTVDLALANRKLLESAGVTALEVLDFCSSCDSGRFFSHRRDAGRTGRHLAVIAGGRTKGGRTTSAGFLTHPSSTL
jgi:hypothetical protein